jgi:hypothetical protein
MRIAQVMAGAPIGGAEAFFERATIALHHAGAAFGVQRADAAIGASSSSKAHPAP